MDIGVGSVMDVGFISVGNGFRLIWTTVVWSECCAEWVEDLETGGVGELVLQRFLGSRWSTCAGVACGLWYQSTVVEEAACRG